MSNVTIVALAALLGAVLLIVVALMLWQESRKRSTSEPVEFVIEDAASYVLTRVPDATAQRLGRDGVLSVVEWHMQWITERIRADEPPVVGLTDFAVHYILEKRPESEPTDVEAVLDEVSEYVASIGAVGPAF